MQEFIERHRRRAGAAVDPAGDVARALGALTDADLARLRALARLWSRGLPGGVGWADILNEAVVRALGGARRWPPGVPLLAFLSGVMRSICDDHWRRAKQEAGWLVRGESAEEAVPAAEAEAPADPERMLAAAQALASIDRLFADDPAALKIIAGLAEGLSARDICRLYGMAERDYDSARKRMRRALLRSGLARGVP